VVDGNVARKWNYWGGLWGT